MNEDRERRWKEALSRALEAPPMPADLKAELLARARRTGRRTWSDRLRDAVNTVCPDTPCLRSRSWALGAAFAAAGAVLAIRLAKPPAPEAASPAALSELWTDDDGGDDES